MNYSKPNHDFAQQRQPTEAVLRGQRSPHFLDPVSDTEFDNFMHTLLSVTRETGDGLTPHSRIELDSLSSPDQYTEPSACKFPENQSKVSEIIRAQPKAGETKQKRTSNISPPNTATPDRTGIEAVHPNSISSLKYETIPPFIQDMSDEPCTCKHGNQSRLSDPPNGAMGDPPVNSSDPHDSRTKVPPDKSANPMQPLILSEPSNSDLGKVRNPVSPRR